MTTILIASIAWLWFFGSLMTVADFNSAGLHGWRAFASSIFWPISFPIALLVILIQDARRAAR